MHGFRAGGRFQQFEQEQRGGFMAEGVLHFQNPSSVAIVWEVFVRKKRQVKQMVHS